MKKKILLLIVSILLISGCNFNEDFSDRYIYTTLYPIEYATTMLYDDYGNIESVYPNGADNTFKVTEKKKNTYAEGEMFIYSGIANEAALAKDLLNKNNKIKLIDATKGLQSNSEITSIWLDPSNYLMLCSNIKRKLIDYNDNVYIKDDIENKYKLLNEKISELDVQLYNIGKNGNYNTILTTNDSLNFLTKYNIDVISIDEDNPSLTKNYSNAKKLIKENKIEYIYYIEGDELTQNQEKLISSSNLVKIEINNIFSLKDEERNEGKDYISIMNDIINDYKKELYKK